MLSYGEDKNEKVFLTHSSYFGTTFAVVIGALKLDLVNQAQCNK